MRILQIISYLYPALSYGGPGKLVYNLSLALAKRGHQITVYTTDAFDEVRRRDINTSPFPNKTGVRTFFFRNISNTLAYQYKFFLPSEGYDTIRKEILSVDAVHTHEFFTPLAIATSYFAKKYKIPFIVSAHGTLDAFHLGHRATAKRIFMYIFGNKILTNTSSFIAATKEEISEYKTLGVDGEKISLIRNGVDIGEFYSLPKKGSFRKKYNLSSNTNTLLYIGRINKLKGLDMLVKGFTSITKNTTSVLVIAGSDDGYLREIKKRVNELNISQKVIFPGKLFGKEKLAAFADCDVFVYPSPSEGFSIAILEAAASGLPLLITDGCKFPEVGIKNAGIVVNSDSDSISKGLKYLLENKIRLQKMGVNAKRLVQQNYSIEKMTQNLEKVYKMVLSTNH